jgi:hypothetical protein
MDFGRRQQHSWLQYIGDGKHGQDRQLLFVGRLQDMHQRAAWLLGCIVFASQMMALRFLFLVLAVCVCVCVLALCVCVSLRRRYACYFGEGLTVDRKMKNGMEEAANFEKLHTNFKHTINTLMHSFSHTLFHTHLHAHRHTHKHTHTHTGSSVSFLLGQRTCA